MKYERWNFEKGEQVVFYIPEGEDIPSSITVRCYTPCEGKKNYLLKSLEEGIYSFTIQFKCLGKYVLIFSEDNIKKLIVIVTVK